LNIESKSEKYLQAKKEKEKSHCTETGNNLGEG
jgi:hypothetical protein